MQNIKFYSIVGERCSGTNYLNFLMKKNVNLSETQKFGWKHGFQLPKKNTIVNDTLCIFIIRNVYDWIRSIDKLRWHANKSVCEKNFTEMIRFPWESSIDGAFGTWLDEGRKGQKIKSDLDDNGNYHPTPLDMRNYKTKKFLQLQHNFKHFYVINYDQLNKNPEKIIREMCQKFNINVKRNFENHIYRKGSNIKFTPKKYDTLTKNNLDFINSKIDWNTENLLGFKSILDPSADIFINKINTDIDPNSNLTILS